MHIPSHMPALEPSSLQQLQRSVSFNHAGKGLPAQGYQRHKGHSISYQALHRQWLGSRRCEGYEHHL